MSDMKRTFSFASLTSFTIKGKADDSDLDDEYVGKEIAHVLIESCFDGTIDCLFDALLERHNEMYPGEALKAGEIRDIPEDEPE